MQGVYVAEASFAVTAAKTLLWIKAPSTATLMVLDAKVTDEDVDTNEQLPFSVTRVTTEGTPAGTGVTPAPTETKSATSGVTSSLCLANLTAEPTTYASSSLDREGASLIGGFRHDPIPEKRVTLKPGESLGVRLLAAPAGSTTLSVVLTYIEI